MGALSTGLLVDYLMSDYDYDYVIIDSVNEHDVTN